MSEDLPIHATCRVCLERCKGNRSISSFAGIIQRYTGTLITVADKEAQPSHLCDGCYNQLVILSKFVKRYNSTNKKLNKFYNSHLHTSITSCSNDNRGEETHLSTKDNARNLEDKENELKGHFRIVRAGEEMGTMKDMVQCLTCGQMVQSKSAFIVHYRKHSGEKPCVCGHCGRSFTQSGTLNEHIKRQHKGGKTEGYRYTCETCGKQFWRRGALTVHIRMHTKEKPYQCSYCPKAFAQFSEHLLHTRTHTGQRPHSCSMCPKSFISHSALRRHYTAHEEERRFPCHICDKHLKSKESLKKHILVMHTAEKKNICEICGAKFSMKYNLKSHMNLRHSEKSGLCTVCDKTFSNLNKHMATHSTDASLSCNICNKKFLKDKAFQSHMSKQHTDPSSMLCCTFEGCTVTFTKQTKLDFHILKTHTKETPYKCQICFKGFYRLADLRKHIKSLHENQNVQQCSVVHVADSGNLNNCSNIAMSNITAL